MKQTAIFGKIGFLSFVACTLMAIWGTGAACAAEYTWNGGAGTWSTSAASWNGSTAWPASGNENDAIFAGTAGTVTLGGDIAVRKITANSPGYVIAGTNTLSGLSELSVASGSLAINAPITNSNITKTGAGTLVLSGMGALTFTYNNYLTPTAALIFSGVTIADIYPTLTATLAGGSIDRDGTSSIVYHPTTENGNTQVWFQMADPSHIKGVRVEFVDTADGVTARAMQAKYVGGITNPAYNFNEGGTVSDIATSLTARAYGVATVSYTGLAKDNSLTIKEGRVEVTGATPLGGATITMDGSALADGESISLYLANNRTVLANQVVVNNSGDGEVILGSTGNITGLGNNNYFARVELNGNVTLDSNANDRTDYKGITGTGDIRITGTGRTVFGVDSSGYTYSGDVTIATTGNGSFQLGTNSASVNVIPDVSNVTIEAGARLNLSHNSGGGEAINGLFGSGTVGNNSGNLNSNILTVGSADGDGDFRGTITGIVSFVKNGTGTQIISGANNYSGITAINGGTLRLEGAGTTLGTGVLTIADGGTLEFAEQGIALTNSGITLDGTLSFDMSATAIDPTTVTAADALVALGATPLTVGGTVAIDLDQLLGSLEGGETTLLLSAGSDFGSAIDWMDSLAGNSAQWWALSYDGLSGGGFGLSATAAALDTSAVPEPATWVMLLAGGVLMVAARRKRMTI